MRLKERTVIPGHCPSYFHREGRTRNAHPTQSRQSARFFLQSSELGPPHFFTHKRVCPPPPFGSGGTPLLAGEGGGVVPTRGQTLWFSRYVYMHFVIPSPMFFLCLGVDSACLAYNKNCNPLKDNSKQKQEV
jgi:hypothetical protein